eukprot:13868288-Alexandrium_andersonii.AAC.1
MKRATTLERAGVDGSTPPLKEPQCCSVGIAYIWEGGSHIEDARAVACIRQHKVLLQHCS